MNNLPTKPEVPDELDKLLAEFFKAQLKKPWPNAPMTPAASAAPANEPSELVTARGGGASQSAPAQPAKRSDNTARARFTLAASVAVLLGAGLVLSNSFTPSARQQNTPTNSGGMLPGGGANEKGVLPEVKEIKANGNTGVPKVNFNEE